MWPRWPCCRRASGHCHTAAFGDIITGVMKANIPSRIAFAVASSMESRIILDMTGAEKLVGKGDMLYFPVGSSKPQRVQGCMITEEEIDRVVSFVKQSGEAHYSDEVMQKIEESLVEKDARGASQTAAEVAESTDPLFNDAVEVLLETGQASVSMLQRRLKLGYSRQPVSLTKWKSGVWSVLLKVPNPGSFWCRGPRGRPIKTAAFLRRKRKSMGGGGRACTDRHPRSRSCLR